jgi:hypothetical protein
MAKVVLFIRVILLWLVAVEGTKVQFLKVKKAQREVRLPIVVNLVVTAFDEASAVVRAVPGVWAFPVFWVVL